MPLVPVCNKFADLPSIDRPPKGREWVYCIRADTPDRIIKIGHATRVKFRLCGLQGSSPVQLSLIGLIQAPAGTEIVFHEALAEHRLHGEWFAPHERTLALVGALPKGDHIESDDVVRLVEPLGMTRAKVLEIFLWAATWDKHRRKYEGKISRSDAAKLMARIDAKNFESALRAKIADFHLGGSTARLC